MRKRAPLYRRMLAGLSPSDDETFGIKEVKAIVWGEQYDLLLKHIIARWPTPLPNFKHRYIGIQSLAIRTGMSLLLEYLIWLDDTKSDLGFGLPEFFKTEVFQRMFYSMVEYAREPNKERCELAFNDWYDAMDWFIKAQFPNAKTRKANVRMLYHTAGHRARKGIFQRREHDQDETIGLA